MSGSEVLEGSFFSECPRNGWELLRSRALPVYFLSKELQFLQAVLLSLRQPQPKRTHRFAKKPSCGDGCRQQQCLSCLSRRRRDICQWLRVRPCRVKQSWLFGGGGISLAESAAPEQCEIRKRRGVQKSTGHKVPWKVGMLTCHPVPLRPLILRRKEAASSPVAFFCRKKQFCLFVASRPPF